MGGQGSQTSASQDARREAPARCSIHSFVSPGDLQAKSEGSRQFTTDPAEARRPGARFGSEG